MPVWGLFPPPSFPESQLWSLGTILTALSMRLGMSTNNVSFHSADQIWWRLKKPFSPPTVTLKEIHDAVPKHLLKSNVDQLLGMLSTYWQNHLEDPIKAAAYVARDITFTLLLLKLASLIGPWADTDFSGFVTSGWNKALLKVILWCTYYWIQGMVWAGIFCLGMTVLFGLSWRQLLIMTGHDAGHGTLFEDNRINNVVGFILHTVRLMCELCMHSLNRV